MAEPVPAAPGTSTAGTSVPAVELSGITKAFPGVIANDDISLRAMAGEVLCLLGENGAGKSTLMSILSGLYQPDSGTIRVGGREVRIDSPRAGRDLGIGMVYQHLSLIPTLTVLENLMLGSNPGLVLDEAGALLRVGELSATLGVQVDPGARVGALALGQQQHIEIIKALWKGSRVLILDEPTSMLTPQGIAELQKVLLGLRAAGLAIIFITHKLHEAIAIGDCVTILKGGRVVGSLGPHDLRATTGAALQAHIVDIMFGADGSQVAGVAEMRQAAAVIPAARRSGTSTPCAPNAAAVRTTAPRLRGSVTPSSATSRGAGAASARSRRSSRGSAGRRPARSGSMVCP